jgi:hypothetical protein
LFGPSLPSEKSKAVAHPNKKPNKMLFGRYFVINQKIIENINPRITIDIILFLMGVRDFNLPCLFKDIDIGMEKKIIIKIGTKVNAKINPPAIQLITKTT